MLRSFTAPARTGFSILHPDYTMKTRTQFAKGYEAFEAKQDLMDLATRKNTPVPRRSTHLFDLSS